MTKREAAIVSAYTGFLIGDFNEFHNYVEEKFGRPVWVHELADKTKAEELHEKSRADFISMKVE